MRSSEQKIHICDQSSILDRSLADKQKLQAELERMRDDLYTINSAKSSNCSLNESHHGLNRKSAKLATNKFSSSFMNKNKMGLRKVLQQQKIKNIVRNFRTKLKRNLSNSPMVEYEPFTKAPQDGLLNKTGFEIPTEFDLVHSVLSIILIIIICFIYPLVIVFDGLVERRELFAFQIVCVFFYLTEMGVNFISVKIVDGRKITVVRDIVLDYWRRKFGIDLLCLVILVLDAAISSEITQYLRILVLLKGKQCLDKLDKIQNLIINNFYKEQYWALAKVFLVNFAVAHCLAILLIAMSFISPTDNWLTKLHIEHSPWYEQYVWAYYWGCTIMLTVGFGDIAASNYKQAICITLIQTFSCILLAYNINCVGNLITNIRQQDIEKNKNLRIMRRLAQENNISQELESKVCSFIDQSDKMKKKFVFEDEKEFVGKLPVQLKANFLKESNIKIFQNLRFFSNFTEKTLLALAEQIEVKIAHPQEIIFKVDNRPQFIILKDGQVGYCTKKNGHEYNGTIIDSLKITKQDNPIVLDLNFLTFENTQSKFQIKSLNYSMIYRIGLPQFLETLKNSQLDFQNFCESRDKSRHILDQYQIITCDYCTVERLTVKHSKMRCPKLHYMPLKQLVAYRYLEAVKYGTCGRQQIRRIFEKSRLNTPLKFRKHFKKLEEQIYKGTTMKSTKNRISREYEDDFECEEEGRDRDRQTTTVTKNTKTHIRSTYDQTKLALRLQKNVLDKIYKIFEQKSAHSSDHFWQVESDSIYNFKFYFVAYNGSELNLDLKNCTNRGDNLEDEKVLFALKTMKNQTTGGRGRSEKFL